MVSAPTQQLKWKLSGVKQNADHKDHSNDMTCLGMTTSPLLHGSREM